MESDISNLSEREKKVFASLVQFPASTDIEIASKINVKHSTFATIKKRLFQQGLFKRYYLPNLADLGAEILSIDIRTVSDSSLPRNGNEETPTKIFNKLDFLREFENIIMSALETNIVVNIIISRNYTDLSESLWKYDYKAKQLGIEFDKRYELNFPIHFSEFPRVRDFSRSIPRFLGVETPLAPHPFNFSFISSANLSLSITKLGWNIFLKFLKNLGVSTREIAQMINKPRTTTTRWLRNYIQTGLLIPRILPNIRQLGYKICVLSYIVIVSSNSAIFTQAMKILDDVYTPMLLARSAHNIFFMALFPTFDSAQAAETDFIQVMNKANVNFKTVYSYLVSIPQTQNILNFNESLVPLVSYLGKPEQTSIIRGRKG